MPFAQYVCTVGEVIADLKLEGDDGLLFDRVKSAAQFMLRKFDNFVPISESRTLDGSSETTLNTGALLSITSVTVDGVAVTDYTAFPRKRWWADGPYSWLERDSGWGETVVITGLWGKYLETEALGVTATQTAGDATLEVANGSGLSKGMQILVGAEQQLVTGVGDATAAVSLLNGAVDIASEVLTVDNGAEFAVGETLQIGLEDIHIVKKAAHQLAVLRGYNGTTKAAHTDDSPIAVYRTFRVARGVNGTTPAAHEAAAVSRYLAPADVNYLARQITALMKQKAETSFSGRAGNSEAGETFFVNEFPRQIEAVRANYTIPGE